MANGIYNKLRDTKAKIRIAILSAYAGAALGAMAGWVWVIHGSSESFQYILLHWFKWRVVNDLGMLDFLLRWGIFPPAELDWLKSVEIRPGWLAALLDMKRTIYYSTAAGAVAVPVLAAVAISIQETRQRNASGSSTDTTGEEFRRN